MKSPRLIDAGLLDALAARLARELALPVKPPRPWQIAGATIGRIGDDRAARLAAFEDVFEVTDQAVLLCGHLASPAARTEALQRVARTLAHEGALTAWRNERYPVATERDVAPLLDLERAAARYFGIRTWAVHANGTVERDGATRMWIARRSATKSIDPGLLDNLVGGGLALGESPGDALAREAWEEAGLPAEQVGRGRSAGALRIVRSVPDGWQDETILVHDLKLPAGCTPSNQDGEVAGFQLMPIDQAVRVAAGLDPAATATVDASLVIAHWVLRHGYAEAGMRSFDRLNAFCR